MADDSDPTTLSFQGMASQITVRLPELLEAVVSVGTGLELHMTLRRIVETAAELAGARYAALGVLNSDGTGLADFVTHGISEEEATRIGALPDGRTGLLGTLIGDPVPLRLADLTADPRSAGFPPNHPPMRAFLGVPIRIHTEVFGNLYLTEKRGGGEFTEEDLHVVRILATEAGIALGNARLYEATRQRERWINGSAALTTALLTGDDAEDALDVVAEQARKLAEAAAGLVLLPTKDGGLEVVAVSADEPAGMLGTVIEAESPVAELLLNGEPVFIDDSSMDVRMTTHLATRFGPSMLLPLKSSDRVIGTLALPRERGGKLFTEVERTLATQFAAQAALALLLADVQRDRERLAVYEDRDRIARDLHDLVIQRLFATGMMLQGAQRRSVVPQVRDGIGKAVDELDATIEEVRTAIFALQQTPADAPAGLRTRVLREIGTAAVPLGFQPSVRFTGAVDALVGELTAKNLIAALREVLSNAFRHAGASRIDVVIDATVALPDEAGTGVQLTVTDDGVGIPEDGRRSGLRNLARRAEALGGSSAYGPGPDGAGTRVVWEAPL
ncbi:GAF domain-containing protein [Streptomyces sp. H10-C2]|uniref:sensor histidine kinase n=1 Tax=unclassified Streptomyces TaxID=2593676 RepID=UPI0024BB4ED7|nr:MULTISPECIES: GAF domain-containing protein [unclassified Streptomyces]MDJ0342057.1 GAF domain-containing protein [Streptomyces sp. PH10-H1]MDJ0368399.1 GAF domain-containing protein [Streptomyces sp. H10-C2]